MIAADTNILIYAPRGETELHGAAASQLGASAMLSMNAVARQADSRDNLMFDAQIAALCREHGIGTILTNDRDFERFEPLQVRHLN